MKRYVLPFELDLQRIAWGEHKLDKMHGFLEEFRQAIFFNFAVVLLAS